LRRLVVATGNPGKLAEFARAFEKEGVEVLGLDAIESGADVVENGSTFEENARLKAEAYSTRTDLPVVADDSGLEVDALGGEPGVRSARYGGAGLDDAGRVRLVLERMKDVPAGERTARFVCVLALARGGKTIGTFCGKVEGTILEEPRGGGGFGYDPVFWHPASKRAFAELSRDEKQRVSHRGAAIARLLAAVHEGQVDLGG